MAATQAELPWPPPNPSNYTPLPPAPNDTVQVQSWRSTFSALGLYVFLLLLAAALLYVLWPAQPSVNVVRLKVKSFHVHKWPHVSVDVYMSAKIKVRNGNVYSMDYDALEVGLGYRGRRLGHVRSQQGHVRAFGSSYIDADVDLSGVRVFSDVLFLLNDFAKGMVPFDTDTQIMNGNLGLFFFHFPFQARVSCEVVVNTRNQTIFNHDCY